MAERTGTHFIKAAAYRAWQFFAALGARLDREDHQLVRSVLGPLGPQAEALFYRMRRNDQRHAVAVLRTLLAAGQQEPALGQAALLHDVGKVMGQPILYRVAIVLLEAYAPAWLDRLALANEPPSASGLERVARWRRPFVVHAWHPALGARMAANVGCGPLAVGLILNHQRTPASGAGAGLLPALQWADAQN
ncbi:MAG: hypothetical protein ACE5H9_01085 [Anaerolineae bacterium]